MYSYLDLLGAWFLCGSSRNVLISWPTGRLVPLWVLPKCTHILTYWAPGSSVGPPEMYSYLDLLGAWFLCGSSRNVLLTYWAPGSSVGPPEMYSYLDLLGAWFLCGSSRNVLISWPTGRLVPLWVLPKCTLDLLGAWFLCGSSRNVLISWPTGRLVPLWVLPKCTHILTYWAPGSSVGPPEMYSYLDLLGAWFLCGSSRNELISWPTGRLVPLWVLPKCTHILTYWAPGSSVEMYSYLDLLGAWFLCGSSRYVLALYESFSLSSPAFFLFFSFPLCVRNCLKIAGFCLLVKK